ncbi:alpha/beta fold hydrolase [Siccirubricoccus deserti]
MRAAVRDTEIYFDIDGPGLVVEGTRMQERPIAFAIHGGPGSDHTGFKPGYTALTEAMQVVYFDHRGQGRSGRGDPARWNLDENVEDMEALRRHLGCGPIVSIGTSYGGMVAMAHAARYPASVSTSSSSSPPRMAASSRGRRRSWRNAARRSSRHSAPRSGPAALPTRPS